MRRGAPARIDLPAAADPAPRKAGRAALPAGRTALRAPRVPPAAGPADPPPPQQPAPRQAGQRRGGGCRCPRGAEGCGCRPGFPAGRIAPGRDRRPAPTWHPAPSAGSAPTAPPHPPPRPRSSAPPPTAAAWPGPAPRTAGRAPPREAGVPRSGPSSGTHLPAPAAPSPCRRCRSACGPAAGASRYGRLSCGSEEFFPRDEFYL